MTTHSVTTADDPVDIDGTTTWKGNPIAAGDIFEIAAGTYTRISGNDLPGTEANPIVITNTGGQVITTPTVDNMFIDCTWVVIDGAGDWSAQDILDNEALMRTGSVVGITFGFQFRDRVRVHNRSLGVTIQHCHFYNYDAAGIFANAQDFPTWDMNDMSFLYNYCELISEMTYMGNAFDDPTELLMERIEIAYNIAQSCQGGYQLRGAKTKADGLIHHNWAFDCTNGEKEWGAIDVGRNCSAKVYNNWLEGNTGFNLNVSFQCRRDVEIFNNVVLFSGDPGFDGRKTAIKQASGVGGEIRIYNNTVIGAGDYGIAVQSGHPDTYVYNNILLDCATAPWLQGGSPAGNFHDNLTDNASYSEDSTAYTVSTIGFVDEATQDYRLIESSPAVDTGTATQAANTDFDDNARDASPDVGAFEFAAEESPSTGTAPLILTAQITADTGGSSQDLEAAEGPGTEPDGVIIFMATATANATPTSGWRFSIGAAANGGSQWSFCSISLDGETDQLSRHVSQIDEVITLVVPDPTTVVAEATVSWAANKATLSWGDAPEGAYLIKAALVWGSFAVGNTTISTTQNGSSSISGLSFAPKVVIALMNETMSGADSRTHLRGGFGMAYYNGSTIAQYGIIGRILNNGSTSALPDGQLSNTRLCGRAGSGGSVDFSIEATNFVSGGFDLTTRDAAGEAGTDVFWIALGGGDDDFWLSTIASPASTGLQNYTTPAKDIASALFIGTGYTALNTARNNSPEAGVIGFGSGVGNGEWSIAVSTEAGAADMNENSIGDNRAMNMMADDGTAGIEFDTFATITNGFSLTWDQVVSGQLVIALGIKQNAALGAWRGLVDEGLISTGLIG